MLGDGVGSGVVPVASQKIYQATYNTQMHSRAIAQLIVG